MVIENRIKYEVELVERLWSQGWAAFRTNASGPGALANTDIVAVKDGSVFILNVVVLEGASSTEKVHSEKKNLEKIKRRVEPNIFVDNITVRLGHAVKRQEEGEWEYADEHIGKIYGKSKYKSLNEVMNK